MTKQAHIRRLQDTLTVVGVGVIAFGAWSLAKICILFLLYDENTQRQMYGIGDDISMQAIYIVFAVVAFIDMAMRLFVGLSARAEGRGKRKGCAYLVVAGIMVALSVASIILIAFGQATFPSLFDMLMSMVIEATSVATLVLMMFCAVRLRRLSGQTE